MSDWFQALYEKRADMVRSLRLNDTEEGIRSLTVDKYTEPIHFVYELLQNAEDQNATEVSFVLAENHLEFIHNGDPFTPADVESITNLGRSQKASQGNKIGCFGIGFKSVLEITDRPEIYTHVDNEPFAFAIEDQFIPTKLAVSPTSPVRLTRFVFPFKQVDNSLYGKIREKLRSLGAETLLFLNHLKTIRWQTAWEEGAYTCERQAPPYEWCDLVSISGSRAAEKQCVKQTYLRFSRPASIAADRPELMIRIAFLVEDRQVKADPGLSVMHVYFPTSEKTGLKFRIHAPMLLTDSRANIKTNNETNRTLIQDCAELLAESLPLLKAEGLFDVECLQCLPIRAVDFPENSTFRPLFVAVRETLRNHPLLPTMAGSAFNHVTPRNGKVSESSTVRGLVDAAQLTELFGHNNDNIVCWLSDRIRKIATRDLWDYVQKELGVDEIDLEEFAGMLEKPFMERQSDEWIIRFYEALVTISSLWKRGMSNVRLRKKEIIRLQDGSHVAPFNAADKPAAFLPSRINLDLPTVKRSICESPDALEFLQNLGLTAPDMVDEVMHLVLPRYGAKQTLDRSEYLGDIELIAGAIEECKPERRGEIEQRLKQTRFVIGVNPTAEVYYWHLPKEIYQPTSDLLEWFAGSASVKFVPNWLYNTPSWQTIQTFLNRNIATVRDTVRVIAVAPAADWYTILRSDRGDHERGLNGFDPNADIDGLKEMLASPNAQKASILWRILLEHAYLLKGDIQKARYQDYRDATTDRTKSRLYDTCTQAEWLPDKSGNFKRPGHVSLLDLADGLDGVSSRAMSLSEALDMKKVEALEKEAENQAFEEFKHYRAEFLAWKRAQVVLPELDEEISDERARRLGDRQQDSPQVTYEKRLRSVRTSSTYLREADREYLRQYCENSDGEMVCQICCDEMPFKIDGQYYFDAVRLLKFNRQLQVQEVLRNKIALCPVCAAKWLHANPHKPEELLCKVMESDGRSITVTLADRTERLHFFGKQFADLKAVLKIAMASQI